MKKEIKMSGEISKLDDYRPDNRVILADCGGIISINNFVLERCGNFKKGDKVVVTISIANNQTYYPSIL